MKKIFLLWTLIFSSGISANCKVYLDLPARLRTIPPLLIEKGYEPTRVEEGARYSLTIDRIDLYAPRGDCNDVIGVSYISTMYDRTDEYNGSGFYGRARRYIYLTCRGNQSDLLNVYRRANKRLINYMKKEMPKCGERAE